MLSCLIESRARDLGHSTNKVHVTLELTTFFDDPVSQFNIVLRGAWCWVRRASHHLHVQPLLKGERITFTPPGQQ